MPRSKKDTDKAARIPTPSLDLSNGTTDEGSGEPSNHKTNGPSNSESITPANRGTDESANYGTSERPTPRFSSPPLTYESMIKPTAPINRKKLGVHVDVRAFDASSEAWREMLRIDSSLNRGVVVEAAMRIALADFAKNGIESSLWQMVERISEAERDN